MYEKIRQQIEKGKVSKEKTIVFGDFNCKIGAEVKGNTKTVTKGGRMLEDLTEKTNMEIINKTDLCTGIWTRVEGGKKSVIDYVLIEKEEMKCIEKMEIDERKEITPYTIEEGRKIYSDHNVITIQANWVITSLENKKISYCLTEKGKKKLKQVTENSQLAKIWEEEGTTQEKYALWNQKVMEITDGIFKKTKRRKAGKSRKIKQFQK